MRTDQVTEMTEAQRRKTQPVATGFVDYFPDAIRAVANLSYTGNQQHNPGKPLHWDRTKSTDEADCLMRHFIERGTLDTDGIRHSAKVAWRALALLQKEIENEQTLRGLVTGDFSGEKRRPVDMSKFQRDNPHLRPLDRAAIEAGERGLRSKDIGLGRQEQVQFFGPTRIGSAPGPDGFSDAEPITVLSEEQL